MCPSIHKYAFNLICMNGMQRNRDVRKPESRFGIGFRKTEPTSKSQNRKSGFRGILKNRKPKVNIHDFSNVCLITESFSWCWWNYNNLTKFYITEYRRLCLRQSMTGDQQALVRLQNNGQTCPPCKIYISGIMYNMIKPNRTAGFNKTEPKPNRTRGFFQNRNRTEVQKSIPHIPNDSKNGRYH